MKPNKKQRQAIQLGKQQQSKQQRDTVCYACNGTGKYDSTGSPKCDACNGTGKISNKA
jgi:DnaJ-class molecular chaperone